MIKIDSSILVKPKFLGIPHVMGKAAFDGCDCVGLPILYLAEFGIKYKYDKNQRASLLHWWKNDPRRFVDWLMQWGNIIRFADINKFDILMFFTDEHVNQFPAALGTMVDDRHFLTTKHERGSFVQMMDMDWKNRFWGAMRLHKVVEAGL